MVMKTLKSKTDSMSSDEDVNYLGEYAGFASRFLAFIIDFLILAVVIAITGLLVSQLLKVSYALIASIFRTALKQPENSNFVISLIILVLVYSIYFIFFWSFTGTTIGGMIIGVRMVNSRGKRPAFARCVIRFITEFVLLPILFIGSIWILISSHRQAWYDRIAGTYVIYNWSARPDERFWTRGRLQKFLEGKKSE